MHRTEKRKKKIHSRSAVWNCWFGDGICTGSNASCEKGVFDADAVSRAHEYGAASYIGRARGDLSVGMPADITIADMDSEYTIDKNTFISKGKNTPFHGHAVSGRVYYTIVDGAVVYQYEPSKD